MEHASLWQSLATINFIRLSTFPTSKNMKLKAHNEYHNDSTQVKGSMTKTAVIINSYKMFRKRFNGISFVKVWTFGILLY